MPSSVTSFSVTKLRPGLQTMTLASVIRMTAQYYPSGLENVGRPAGRSSLFAAAALILGASRADIRERG